MRRRHSLRRLVSALPGCGSPGSSPMRRRHSLRRLVSALPGCGSPSSATLSATAWGSPQRSTRSRTNRGPPPTHSGGLGAGGIRGGASLPALVGTGGPSPFPHLLSPQFLGILLLAFSFWVLFDRQSFAAVLGSPLAGLRLCSYGLSGVGTAAMLLGFLGCLGALKELRALLGLYFGLLLLLLAAQVTVAIIVYTQRAAVREGAAPAGGHPGVVGGTLESGGILGSPCRERLLGRVRPGLHLRCLRPRADR
ncbi:uncharacterized protein LOC121344541 [Onychostruthus taczanowskii]|uniref:uncharacterized protein LOC121344541 n=1 Tax=Onychostruthus taczanowskii TaxID=356909 RepID=UPI001B80BD40|nr:uncharacterized protein LOC121344541 [Onychostruthus taczanowskii]